MKEKYGIMILVFTIMMYSCGTTSEFVPSSNLVKNQLQNLDVKLYFSELNAPDYTEIGLIRITTDYNNLTNAAEKALKEIENTNANCLIYKQMAAYDSSESSDTYIFEFIAGKLVEKE